MERRSELREKITEGAVQIGAKYYSVVDWSPSAFLLDRWDRECSVGHVVYMFLSLELPEGRMAFACSGSIVRCDNKEHRVAVRFDDSVKALRTRIATHFGAL